MSEVRISSVTLEVDASHDGFCNVRQQVQRMGIAGPRTQIEFDERVIHEDNDDFNIVIKGAVVHWKRINPTGKKYIAIPFLLN